MIETSRSIIAQKTRGNKTILQNDQIDKTRVTLLEDECYLQFFNELFIETNIMYILICNVAQSNLEVFRSLNSSCNHIYY